MKSLLYILIVIVLIAVFATTGISGKKLRNNKALSPKKKLDPNYVDPDTFANMLGRPKEVTHRCIEKVALETCDMYCMCQIMVNHQIGLWAHVLPQSDVTESDPKDVKDKYIGDSTPRSQCDIWRQNEDITDENCYAMCTMAEQYVLAAHGWDAKVCARAEEEGKAYILHKK